MTRRNTGVTSYFHAFSPMGKKCAVVSYRNYICGPLAACQIYGLLRDAILAFMCVEGLAPSYLADKFATHSSVHSVYHPQQTQAINSKIYVCCRLTPLWSSHVELTATHRYGQHQVSSFKRDFRNHLLTIFN